MTYANVETRDLTFLKYALSPWIVRLESALSGLVGRSQYVRFKRDAFLRTDTLSRYQAHAIALDKRFLTVDEVRAREDREPLPAGTDSPRIGAVA